MCVQYYLLMPVFLLANPKQATFQNRGPLIFVSAVYVVMVVPLHTPPK